MKKRIWSLMLCLALVCAGFSGCGDKDDATGGMLPERFVRSKLQEFVDGVSDILTNTDEYMISMDNVGYDFTAEYMFEGQNEEGEESTRTEGVKGSMDAGEGDGMHLAASLYVNEEDVFAVDVITEGEAIYVNLPAYTKDYMGISVGNFLEMAAGLMSGTKDLLAVCGYFSTDKFVKAFEYQDKEEKQTIGIGDYKITGDKYITKAKTEDINAAFEMFIGELGKLRGISVVEFMPISSEWDTFNANYYTGKNGAYAWEFQGSIGDVTQSVVYISAEKGFYLYVVDGNGKEKPLAFSTKESAQKGKITICVDGKISIEYDNYTKNSLDISTTIEGMTFQVKLRSVGKTNSVEFGISNEGADFSGKLENAEDHVDLNISITTGGAEALTIKMNSKRRDFVPYDEPNVVNLDEWVAGLDEEKLEEGVNRLVTLFPFLADMLQNTMLKDMLQNATLH